MSNTPTAHDFAAKLTDTDLTACTARAWPCLHCVVLVHAHEPTPIATSTCSHEEAASGRRGGCTPGDAPAMPTGWPRGTQCPSTGWPHASPPSGAGLAAPPRGGPDALLEVDTAGSAVRAPFGAGSPQCKRWLYGLSQAWAWRSAASRGALAPSRCDVFATGSSGSCTAGARSRGTRSHECASRLGVLADSTWYNVYRYLPPLDHVVPTNSSATSILAHGLAGTQNSPARMPHHVGPFARPLYRLQLTKIWTACDGAHLVQAHAENAVATRAS